MGAVESGFNVYTIWWGRRQPGGSPWQPAAAQVSVVMWIIPTAVMVRAETEPPTPDIRFRYPNTLAACVRPGTRRKPSLGECFPLASRLCGLSNRWCGGVTRKNDGIEPSIRCCQYVSFIHMATLSWAALSLST